MNNVSRKAEVEELQKRKRELDAIISTKMEFNSFLESLTEILNELNRKQAVLESRLNAQIKAISRNIHRERVLANKSSKSGLNHKDYHLGKVSHFESELATLKEQLSQPNEDLEQINKMVSNIVAEINWYYREIRFIEFELEKDYQKIVESVKNSRIS